MSQDQQPSGVDLAQIALKAAKEAARKNGGRAPQPQPRTTRPARRDGRDPMGLGNIRGALVAERAWELPAAGATLRERWGGHRPGTGRARRLRRPLKPAHRAPRVDGLGDEDEPRTCPRPTKIADASMEHRGEYLLAVRLEQLHEQTATRTMADVQRHS